MSKKKKKVRMISNWYNKTYLNIDGNESIFEYER